MIGVLRQLARISPRRSVPEDLDVAVSFLESDLDPAIVARGADGLGMLLFAIGTVFAVVLGGPATIAIVLGVSLGAVAVVRGVPVLLASARRTRAIGEAPALVSRAVLMVRITPTAERGAAFAARDDGILGESLSQHVRRAQGTPRSGLGEFAETWRNCFPALHRAILLVEAATDAPTGDRDRTLDRAMEAVLDGTRDRAATAAADLGSPSTALYAFGVLLPLALVGVLPAAGAAGLEASITVVVLVYDVVLPSGLLVATGWLLARRPVAFPPTSIGREHPDVPDRRLVAVSGGFGFALTGWIVASYLDLSWARALAAIGVGTGAGLLLYFRPIVTARARVRAFEATLPDALYLVGRRVVDGIAVERAIAETATELDDPGSAVFEETARRIRQLRIDVETAFLGEFGSLEAFPSPRALSAARLLDVAAREGAPAGRTLVETADHLDDLRRIERESRRDLGRVTGTLANTAGIFGPLIGGATVAMADAFDGTGTLGGTVPSTPELGAAIGAYVLLLATILTALSVGLERGFDRAAVGYRVGASLLSATTIYVVGFLVAGMTSGSL